MGRMSDAMLAMSSPRMCLSTQDYNEACGFRPRSPLASKQEREIFSKNQQIKRNKIETELSKIPLEKQNNLNIYISVYPPNDGLPQSIEVIILERNQLFPSRWNFEYYHPKEVDLDIYPEIWKNFNLEPFYYKCEHCNFIDTQLHINKCKICNHIIRFGDNKKNKKTLEYMINNDKEYLEWINRKAIYINKESKKYINHILTNYKSKN